MGYPHTERLHWVTQAVRVRSNIGYTRKVSYDLSGVVGTLTVIVIGYSASRHVYVEWEGQEWPGSE